MDLICVNCGEPWEMDYVLHEEPSDFTRKGSAIVHCPSCPREGEEINVHRKERAMMAGAIADILGDDVDGAASEMDGLW